jgi:hypothetical protein
MIGVKRRVTTVVVAQPRRRASGYGETGSIHSPSDLFIHAVTSRTNRARVTVANPNHRVEIAGGKVPYTYDLFQSTVPWRSRLAHLTQQL